jgi:hypothetical protein
MSFSQSHGYGKASIHFVMKGIIFYLLVSLANGFSQGWRNAVETRQNQNQHFSFALNIMNRRDVLSSVLSIQLVSILSPQYVHAKDELFRPNPLTNPVLEQIRIWDQEYADNIKYGGELEKGDAGNKGKVEAYPMLLVPIIEMSQDITRVQELVLKRDQISYRQARDAISKPMYEKVAFKKIFNAYGDNIYYSDPDRANLYLGGGAVPKTNQTLAYLIRNELLNALENLRAELDFLLSDAGKSESPDDLLQYSQACTVAMTKYLDLVPPGELTRAQEILQQSSK